MNAPEEEEEEATLEVQPNPEQELSPVDFKQMYTYMKDEKNTARGQTDGLE